MVDGFGEEETTRVKAEFGHIESIVAVDEPEEAECDDIKHHDERCNYAINQACRSLDVKETVCDIGDIPIDARVV